MLSLINDLLDLAKIESGKVEVNFEPVDCNSVMQEVGSSLRPLAESKDLAFEISTSSQSITILTDRRALSQILINLTSNAIKFTEQGTVRLDLVQRDINGRTQTEISVTDTGIGIKTEDQTRLFHAFEQMESLGKRRYEGTGLGLHLSQKLASLIGGHIEVESQYGKGSRFSLIIVARAP